jgi:hypothetical protein
MMNDRQTPSKKAAPEAVRAVRRALLDNLMASDLGAWERSLYLTRLYLGYDDPTRNWRRLSLPAFRERAGRYGIDPTTVHALKTLPQVGKGHKSLEERGLWERRPAKLTPEQLKGHDATHRPPYETCLRPWPSIGEAPSARCDLAYTAIAYMAFHVSPLGPELEDFYCRLWFMVDQDGDLTLTRKDWAERLGLSINGARDILRKLAEADVGVHLAELEPEPGTGARARLYSIKMGAVPGNGVARRGFLIDDINRAEEKRAIERLAEGMRRSAQHEPTRSPLTVEGNGTLLVGEPESPRLPSSARALDGKKQGAEAIDDDEALSSPWDDDADVSDDDVPWDSILAGSPVEAPEHRSEAPANEATGIDESSESMLLKLGVELEGADCDEGLLVTADT